MERHCDLIFDSVIPPLSTAKPVKAE